MELHSLYRQASYAHVVAMQAIISEHGCEGIDVSNKIHRELAFHARAAAKFHNPDGWVLLGDFWRSTQKNELALRCYLAAMRGRSHVGAFHAAEIHERQHDLAFAVECYKLAYMFLQNERSADVDDDDVSVSLDDDDEGSSSSGESNGRRRG